MAKKSGWVAWNRKQRRYKMLDRQRAEAEALFTNDYGPEPWADKPTGRAPRGEGASYQARRWLNKTQATLQTNISKLEGVLTRYRGQASQRLRITKARARLQALRTARAQAESVVKNPLATWTEKKQAVQMIMSYAEYQYLE